jgi:hypothetical protein
MPSKKKNSKQMNPKSHDSLFKWLISAFLVDFFAHYFPDITIEKFSFIDKEFISKYKPLKESLKGDLFIAVEMEIDKVWHQVIIHIELESKRSDMRERVFQYLCYGWLLKQMPIWSIVVYTDDAKWRKPLPKSYWYAFTKDKKKLYHEFDIIKVNKEKSKDLIQKKSLLCKLLALKADDTDISPEDIIRDIYQTVYEMKDSLTDDQLLLVEQFVDYYRKIPQQTFSKIKKEVNMSFAATTITEHYINIGEERGEKRGLLKGKLQTIQELYEKNIIQKDIFLEMSTSIKEQIKRLTARSRRKAKK